MNRFAPLGASLPLQVVNEKLKVPSLIVPTANSDNHQHSENENLKISALFEGLETAFALMMMK